jgi:methyltransferase (TIGR00027 family)
MLCYKETTMAPVLIKNTLDIAQMVAFHRAAESKRRGARFHDPYAQSLAGERGKEIAHALPQRKANMWSIVLRTCIYDEIILDVVRQKQIDTVITLAAGLDSRPYRLPLPPALRWIEVDQPDVISYKQERLVHARPVCLLEHIPLEITDHRQRQDLFAQVKEARQALILTEGLLTYLSERQVAAIATDLHEQEALRWWLTQIASPLVLQKNEKYWNSFAANAVKMRFAPPEGEEFFEMLGWHVIEFRSPIHEALRLNLPIRYGWLFRLLTHFSGDQQGQRIAYNSGGIVLLERA